MDKHPLQTLIEEAGHECQSYSGRAMYGKRCLAVVCNARRLGNLIADLLRDASMFDDGQDIEEVATAMQGLCWDNMGMDMVYYWPDVPYTADEEEDNGDDEEA